mmetsp:Transcript_19553/g.16108  ORF Transcript_19553/g.16108 Transcript_19553/m.16108 type:complete len:87 (-) Transcript_19553:185-445(-)
MTVIKIDDPLDAFSVHGVCGMWGVLSSGIVRVWNGAEMRIFYGCVLGLVVIAVWTIVSSSLVFFFLWFTDSLRVSTEIENKGLDKT